MEKNNLIGGQYRFIYNKLFRNKNVMIRIHGFDFTFGESRFILNGFPQINDMGNSIKIVISEQIREDLNNESVKA